ncbi:hypothetical protein Q4595_19940, partial [Wenyingzhuangia sp. 1_MG-2023]|nr:hypothetical protein [Wenyingzhuangia sp. 1_MG-2023]
PFTFGYTPDNLNVRVQLTEDFINPGFAGDDGSFAADNTGVGALLYRDQAGRNIPTADIFGEGGGNGGGNIGSV